MNCALCGTQTDGACTLHGKAICTACLGELSAGPAGARQTVDTEFLREGRAEGSSSVEHEEGEETDVLPELNAELARLNVTEEDVGPADCIVAEKQGTLFQLSDDTTSAVASGEKLLDRLRTLPDGAGLHATWWMLADL